MTEIDIDVEGLDEAIQKMSRFPNRMKRQMRNTMNDSLEVLSENVPPYPPKPPESDYRRTMTLAGSLGTTQSGGKAGKPTVYSVSGSGGNIQGRFGTDLSYAKHVIDPERQAYMHRPGYKGRQGWWTMDTIKERANAKIQRIWQDMVKLILGL